MKKKKNLLVEKKMQERNGFSVEGTKEEKW